MKKKREEKAINHHGSSSSKSTCSLPLDLTSEILLRLPTKSVLRFRSVSKQWLSITTDPYFIKSFQNPSLRKKSVLAFYKKTDTMFVFSSIPEDNQNSSSKPNDHYQMKLTENEYRFPTESVHGLICFLESAKPVTWNPVIWNRTMRKFLTLPKPEESWKKDIACLLGYDPIEGKHKVLCIQTTKVSDECRVLTLGSDQESWRTVNTGYQNISYIGCYGRCINGVVYYKACKRVGQLNVDIIMSFDLRSEKFAEITSPRDNYLCFLIPFEGRLAILGTNHKDGGITLWILEDAKKHKWTSRNFHAPSDYFGEEGHFQLDSISHTGEIIYAPFEFLGSFSVLFFDLKKKRFRKIEFADEEFRIRYGLGTSYREGLYCAPNHIESLLTL